MYRYRAIITKVYDGDTVTADIDLGLQMWMKGVKLRLLGIDAPELRTKDLAEKAAAIQARERLKDLILDKEVFLETKKRGKYGRWLVTIIFNDRDVKDILLEEGLVSEYSKKT